MYERTARWRYGADRYAIRHQRKHISATRVGRSNPWGRGLPVPKPWAYSHPAGYSGTAQKEAPVDAEASLLEE